MENNKNDPKKPDNGDKRPKPNLWVTLIITVVVVLAGSILFNFVRESQYEEVTWNRFREEMNAKNLEEVQLRHDRIIFLTKSEKDGEQKAYFTGEEVKTHKTDREKRHREEYRAHYTILAGEKHRTADGDENTGGYGQTQGFFQHRTTFPSPSTISPIT